MQQECDIELSDRATNLLPIETQMTDILSKTLTTASKAKTAAHICLNCFKSQRILSWKQQAAKTFHLILRYKSGNHSAEQLPKFPPFSPNFQIPFTGKFLNRFQV